MGDGEIIEAGSAVRGTDEELRLLRDFFDNASLGMHWVGADGTILRANSADYTPYGYSEEEYVGHNIAEFHVDAAAIAEIIARLGARETLIDWPARIRCKDGSVRSVLINSSANFHDGQFANTRCITRDVTREAESALAIRLSEERYRALVQALPALIVTTTAAGEIDEINESYEAYTGLTIEQARDWARHNVIHPDDYVQSMEVWAQAIKTGEPMQNEMRLRRHDGAYRWYLVQAVPVRDEAGNAVRWVTVNIDIEERKRAEARERYLAQTTAKLISPLGSEGMLAEIARLAVPVLADVCAIGLFDDSTETARVETAGANQREKPYVETIHLRGWLAAPRAALTIGETIASGQSIFVQDFSASWITSCAPNQAQIDAASAIGARSLICVPLLARGAPIGMATFAMTQSQRSYSERDLTLLHEVASRLSIAIENVQLFDELTETTQELKRANAAKDEFLGLVSHELKTPITTIFGNAEVLRIRDDQIDAESRRGALEDIAKESGRLNRIIDNLLVLARLERGQQFEMEPILLPRLVEKVVREHRIHFPDRVVQVVAPTDLQPVLAEPLYAEQVVRNLLSNSEKYSPPGAPIELRLASGDGVVRVSVLDRGYGIAPEEAESLFVPFYRSVRTSSHAAGIGIGLAVCKRLIEAQDGQIWASSRPDGGSDFSFTLPISDCTE